MGDNVYADSADPAKLKESYDLLAEIPGVAELRESTPIVATWDDHDYGKNDVGAEWEGKEASKEAFMEFFETPADSPLRKRGGVYDAKIFGPEGKRVQVILLDTRWFRGPLRKLTKDFPLFSASVFVASTSIPRTWVPFSQNRSASGRPT